MEEPRYLSGHSKVIHLFASGYILHEISCELFYFIYCNTSALIFKTFTRQLFCLIKMPPVGLYLTFEIETSVVTPNLISLQH
jgi:hypothetical protein